MSQNEKNEKEVVYKSEIDINSIQSDAKANRHLVDALKESINTIGLTNPVVLKKIRTNEYAVLAGNNRYLACKELGHKTIKGFIVKNSSPEYDCLVKADENLVRRQLSCIEQAQLLYDRKLQLAKLNKISKQGGDKSKDQNLAFAKLIGPVINISKSKVNEYISLVEDLQGEIIEAIKTFDKPVKYITLKKITKLGPEEKLDLKSKIHEFDYEKLQEYLKPREKEDFIDLSNARKYFDTFEANISTVCNLRNEQNNILTEDQRDYINKLIKLFRNSLSLLEKEVEIVDGVSRG